MKLLGAKGSPQFIACKEGGFQSYNHKDLDSADNPKESEWNLPPEPPDRNTACQPLDFSLVRPRIEEPCEAPNPDPWKL